MQKTCPKDGGELTVTDVNGVTVDTCSTCEGVWFDAAELRDVLQQDQADVKEDLRESWVADVSDAGSNRDDRKCPVCEQPLHTYNYAYDSGVEINGCTSHHGVWLDDGEMQKVFKHYIDSTDDLSAEEKAQITKLIDQANAHVAAWEQQVKDSMVTSDDKGGILRAPGHVLQGIYNVMYEIEQKF